MADVFDPTVADPLEQLRLWIHRFLQFSAEYPELLGLMNIEGREDTGRLAYIYERYVDPSMGRVERLLEHLADAGRIRRVPLRTFHFLLAHAAPPPTPCSRWRSTSTRARRSSRRPSTPTRGSSPTS